MRSRGIIRKRRVRNADQSYSRIRVRQPDNSLFVQDVQPSRRVDGSPITGKALSAMTNRSTIGGCPIPSFATMHVLDEHPNTRAANAIRLQLLTGARLGEVLGSRKEISISSAASGPSQRIRQAEADRTSTAQRQALAVVALTIEQAIRIPFLFRGNRPVSRCARSKNSGAT